MKILTIETHAMTTITSNELAAVQGGFRPGTGSGGRGNPLHPLLPSRRHPSQSGGRGNPAHPLVPDR